jgi:hypothetical protein
MGIISQQVSSGYIRRKEGWWGAVLFRRRRRRRCLAAVSVEREAGVTAKLVPEAELVPKTE